MIEIVFCSTLENQLRLLIVRLSHKTTKQQHSQAEAKISQIFSRQHNVEGILIIGCNQQDL